MQPKNSKRERILEELEKLGGELSAENIRKISKETGIPAADIYGAGSFYELFTHHDVDHRVCQGLTCIMAGAEEALDKCRSIGDSALPVSCLGQCDYAPAVLSKGRLFSPPRDAHLTPDNSDLPINLSGKDDLGYTALERVRGMDPDVFLEHLEASGLQGRGGAGFPAAFKWKSVRSQAETVRYVVCNADEGEPGTFKDREVMLRRPNLLLEGLAIAAHIVAAKQIYIYIRGEFLLCRHRLEEAIEAAGDLLADFDFIFVNGQGAYICGEETALLESIEGRRGMPRMKPPYPTVSGLFGKPTLMNNVETLACVPSIVLRGGDWFRAQGRTEPGSKLYCLSGHVRNPGVYELPLGASLDELVDCAGGYVGNPIAFSPGGASSGFLPIRFRNAPLDFKSLAKLESMLGSAGVVVLNDTVDMAEAAYWQAVFFEDESCGQCAPCRIGTRLLTRAMRSYLRDKTPERLRHLELIGLEMEEGSICGLGIAAPLSVISARKYFPDAFGARE
jgi:NADH:ubiquinone oxidoreductase subunit F (NADH-binding)